jgi:VanZ family protein
LSKRPIKPAELAVAVILVFILVITLAPADRTTQSGAGHRWLADAILNLLLFVPLGLTLKWNFRSATAAVFCGLLISGAVEVAQLWIPRRETSLSDVAFNTIGTAVGVVMGLRPRTWLVPTAKSSVALTSAAVASAAVLMTLTALLLAPSTDGFIINRAGNDLVLQYPARADATGLDQPVYWVRHAFQNAADTSRVSVQRDRARWHVRTDPARETTLGPSVGKGWSLLAYPDAIGRRWGAALGAVWLFGLCIPIGFWARRRLALPAAGAVAFFLVLIPAITGVVPTPFIEWIGAASGLLTGVALGWSSHRIVARSAAPNSISAL